MKRLLSVILVAALIGGGVWAYLSTQSRGNAPRFRTAAVERGPLVASASATGALAAVVTVTVGSQISGQIKELHADFNSPVRRGQVVARLDPATYEARVNQARADVDTARAAVLNQEAQVERARADKKPSLIEARTYRFRGHSMRDPAGAVYRTKEEVEREKQRDPILLFRDRARSAGVLGDDDVRTIEKDVNDIIDEAVAFADASPEPPLEWLLTDIFKEG